MFNDAVILKANTAIESIQTRTELKKSISKNLKSLASQFQSGVVDSIPYYTEIWSVSDGWTIQYVNSVSLAYDIYRKKGVVGSKIPYHTHKQIETITVITGKIKLSTNTETVILSSGDVYILDNYTPHEIICLEECELMVFYHPPITKFS